MFNSPTGRSAEPTPNLQKLIPRSAMDAQFAFTITNRFTAPFTAALDDALARLASAAFCYVVPAIDRRLNARTRRRIKRALRRQIDAEAHRILMTGQP